MTSDSTRHRDRGVTLIELLVGVALMSLLTVALCGGIVAILRQSDNTTGRLNNSRAEQAVGTYMPTDLASASRVSVDPSLSPCGTSCPASANTGGSSALFLSWDTLGDNGSLVVTYTTVSYRYLQVGTEWQLARVECKQVGAGAAYTCNTRAVVHNLDGPPGPFTPGQTVPSWVIQVSIPLDPDDPGNTGTTLAPNPNAQNKGAQRVIVTINGGGDAGGAGGGINQISLSAGGTTRQTIPANSTFGVPNFTAARSRCGGYVTLVVDVSGSIGSAITNVRTAVTGFINAFAGTPVQLEVVAFSSKSSVLGSSSWSSYTDMLNASAVTTLRNAVSSLNSGGSTNYEDAFYRVFKNKDGTQNSIVPGLVVFFTDGIPTVNRRYQSNGTNTTSYNSGTGTIVGTGSYTAYPPPAEVNFPATDAVGFDQESFNRADTLLTTYRSQTRIVGVGVGQDIDSETWPDTSEFITTANGYKVNTSKSGSAYQRGYNVQSGRFVYTSPYDYWETTDQATYNANNTSNNSNDGWRAVQKLSSTPYAYGGRASNRDILRKIVMGAGSVAAEELLPDGSNATDADIAFNANFNQLPATLASIAVGECGGTLTLQTQQSGAAAGDPFTYQNTATNDSTGTATGQSGTVVTTTAQSKSGTFDFDVSNSYVDVDIIPANLSDLAAYQPGGWSCTVGPNSRAITAIPVSGSAWTGFRVRIAANESVSCVQSVTRTP